MIPALIVTHGKLGEELLKAVEQVLGPQAEVTFLSNNGLSLEQLQSMVQSKLSAESTAVFVDFCGGSPYVACKYLRDTYTSSAIISGVNFPMLLSFFTKREKFPFDELVEIVKSDGLRGIQLLKE